MKQILIITLLFISIFLHNNQSAFADRYSKPLAINSHIRVMPYSPNEVHHYVGFYGYAANILFESGEEIVTISMGDPTAWQITPNGNRLFIKPVQEHPETNAMIITNRRVYHFLLTAREATGLFDKDLVFETRFAYPDAVITSFSSGNSSYIPDVNDQDILQNLNFDYLVSGADRIKPIRVFDDGKFTYVEFNPRSTTLPAIFYVEEDGYESMVNVRTVGKTLIVEKLGSMFTLRYDTIYACVYNRSNPWSIKEGVSKKKKSKNGGCKKSKKGKFSY